MLHQKIFNATLSATFEPRLLLDKHDLFLLSVVHSVMIDVALKVNGGGVTLTNSNKLERQRCWFLSRLEKPATCFRNEMSR